MALSKSKFSAYAHDPSEFRRDLLIDVDGVVRKFGAVIEEWQESDFRALDPGLLRCTGQKPNVDCRMRGYLERARGHSKTTDLAVVCSYALAFGTRPLAGYAYAADKDQASLLKNAISTLLRLNPWLNDILRVDANRVINHATGHPGFGGTLTISTSDVASSYGILPDLIIADELCHWTGEGELWHSLISSAAKRSNCLLYVITNSGFVDSWQWKVREAIRTDPSWYFSRLDGPKASWMTEARLEEQRRMLPPVAFARLWLNEWSSGGGDALRSEDIEAAFSSSLGPMYGNESGYSFVAGVDLGLSRDCSAVVVLGVRQVGGERGGNIRLANARTWKPMRGVKVNLTDVERHIAHLRQKYRLKTVAYDPWQAEHLAQRLRCEHIPMEEKPATGKNLQAIASITIESFTDRRIDLFDYETLRQDLRKLRVEERSYGYRLVSPRDETGHGDLVSAFGLALHSAYELAGKPKRIVGALF
jgi:hypothetical protein